MVALEVDGVFLDEIVADGIRTDVSDVTQGPEHVGFVFELDDELLQAHGGKPFRVVDVETGNALSAEGHLLPTLNRRLMIDVGDTLIYFHSHGTASGIQRVVTEVTKALESLDSEICLVAGKHDGSGVYTVDARLWRRLVKALSADPGQAVDAARAVVADSFAGQPITPRPGDVLVAIGAPWIAESYVQSAIRFRQSGGRVLFMVYDIIPLRLQHQFDAEARAGFTRFLVTASLVADGVLCISEYTRRDYEAYCAEMGIAPPPTRVTRLASSLIVGKRRSQRAGDKPRLGGTAGYALLVSTIEGRKGHALLLRVWSRLIRELGRDSVPDLVFVGRPGWHAQDVYGVLSRTGYLDGKVHVLSSVSDEELAQLYASASFSVYPSTFEGWGLPVAESLTCGTPVIASDATSIPEVGGDAVTYFPSGDESALYEAVSNWVRSPDVLAKATARTASFVPDRWADVAQAVVKFASEVSTRADDRLFATKLGYAQEVLFSGVSLLEDNSDFLEASWQQQVVRATPIMRQPPQTLSNALGSLVLRGNFYDAESAGRWSQLGRPFELALRLDSPAPAVLYLSLSSGSPEHPTLLHLRGDCRADSVWLRGHRGLGESRRRTTAAAV